MNIQANHYRWGDLSEDHPMELITRRRVIGENVMISRVELTAGCHVPTHEHENEQIAIIVSGRGRFGIGPEGSADRHEIGVDGGEVVHLPSRLPHSFEAVTDCLILDVFSPPSAGTGIDRS